MLVGRGTELDRVAERLSADQPTAVVGEAGIGKTTLLSAVAQASGRQVFKGGALSTLSWLRYLAFDRALGREVAGGDPAAVAAEVESAVGSGVLLLDDLQWAAPETLDGVELLAGRIGLLAGVRRGHSAAEPVLDRLRDAGFEIIELPGLADADAVSLVRETRPDLGPAAASRIAARAGGNPLLLRELAATGEPTASLRLALEARLRQLDEPGREAFGILSLVGRPVDADTLGAAGAKSLLTADLATEPAPGVVELRHALLGEIAMSLLDAEERRRLHALIARAVSEPGEAARHYAQAGERSAAYDHAMQAAAAADRAGERASHLAVAATCAEGPLADTLRLQAAWALEEAHDWPALTAVVDQLADAPPEVRAEAALIRARASWQAGDPEGVREALTAGLAAVAGSGKPIETRLLIEQTRIPTFLDSDPDTGLRESRRAVGLARRTGIDVPRALYLYGTALYMACSPEAGRVLQEAIDGARAAGDVGTELVAANNFVVYQESAGDPAVGRAMAREYADRCRELGLAVWERSFRIALSNLDFHAGNYDDVLTAADELLDLPLEARSREALLEQLCLSLVDLGRFEEAERWIATLPERLDDWTSERQRCWVRCEAALWGGRPQRALQLADRLLAGPAGDLNIVFAAVSRGWAAFHLGRPPGERPTGDYPPILHGAPYEVDGIRSLHEDRPSDAVTAFDRAGQAWSRYHRRGELRCAWAAGEAARRAGLPDAVDRLLAVEARAESLRMVPLLGTIRRSLRAAGVARSAAVLHRNTELLTARQREVLRLVGAGLSNAEIAGRLGISRHTVVSQITAASLKLGATGRTQAAALADRLTTAVSVTA